MSSEAPTSGPPERRPRSGWAVPLALVLVVAMLVLAGLYVFRSLRQLPGDAASAGLQALERLESVAAAFTQGTVTTTFLSYASKATGTSYFQFATLEQQEVFRRTDTASVLWGKLQLPDVVVEASAPVTYTYYLDLDSPWELRRQGQQVLVLAPPIRLNPPAIDVSRMELSTRSTSFLRDEDAALEALRAGLTEMARRRGRQHVELVRELGRKQVEEFVGTWLMGNFADGEQWDVEVVFPDEVPEVAAPEGEG